MSIQSFVLRRCVSASSFGFPANSGLKWDQFNSGCTGGAAGYTGWAAGCVGGAWDDAGGAGTAEGGCGAGGPPSAIFIYVSSRNVYMTGKRLLNPIPKKKHNQLIMMNNLISYMKLIYVCPDKALNNYR